MLEKRKAAQALAGAGGTGGGRLDSIIGLRQGIITKPVACQEPRHGVVRGDVWGKRICGSKHLLRRPPAIAVDEADLDAAERCGARLVHIQDVEGGRHFWALLSTIRAFGFVLDRGFGAQIALPLAWWRPSREEGESLAEKPQAEPQAVQLSFLEARR